MAGLWIKLTILVADDIRLGSGLQLLHEFKLGVNACGDWDHIIFDVLLDPPHFLCDHCLQNCLLCSGKVGIRGISASIVFEISESYLEDLFNTSALISQRNPIQLFQEIVFRQWQIQYQWLLIQFNCRRNSMKGRGDKLKGEYFIDSKQITAKKGKKHTDSFTPNSLSTSHNHHKYEKFDEKVEAISEKQVITANQMESAIRSLHLYARTAATDSLEQLRRKELTGRLYWYLRDRYKMVGERKQIERVELMIEALIPQQRRLCERCKSEGLKCSEAHLKYLNEILPQDIEVLKEQLLELELQNTLCSKILHHRGPSSDKQNTLAQLMEVIKHQQDIIEQLDRKPKNQIIGYNKKKAKLEIFIDDEEHERE